MKTAQKILLTALTLFNEHGENTVTSVDIAIELDISRGISTTLKQGQPG